MHKFACIRLLTFNGDLYRYIVESNPLLDTVMIELVPYRLNLFDIASIYQNAGKGPDKINRTSTQKQRYTRNCVSENLVSVCLVFKYYWLEKLWVNVFRFY